MSYLRTSMRSDQHLVKHFFPNGFRVMIVDADHESLKLAGAMFSSCNYKVTLCADPKVALSILRERHQDFDLVLAEVFMPELDGFELLQAVKELSIPVVLMASGNDMDLRMNGIMKGAASFIDKPLEHVLVNSIWKNTAWKNISLMAESENKNQEDEKQIKNDKGKSAISIEENNNDSISDQEVNNGEEDHDFKKVTKRNGRLCWTPYLEKLFENALIQLGPDAVPGKIAKLMNVEGVERHHVASHLQKYRIRLQKEALLLQANNEKNQMYQTQLQPEQLQPQPQPELLSQPQSLLQPQLQPELQSQHQPGQYFNSPPNYLPNYNHFHPSAGVMPQHALYQQEAVPNNINPISYADDIPAFSNLEMSINQLGLNEGLQGPTYPQLHHEQHYASIQDGNQLPPPIDPSLQNLQEFSGFGFENLDVLPHFQQEKQIVADETSHILNTNMAFPNEFKLETGMDFNGISANSNMLFENQIMEENYVPQLQFTDHHENLNNLFSDHETTVPLHNNQFQNIDHGQQQHAVNEVGRPSNTDASMTFTNLLNVSNDRNEDLEFLNNIFMP